MAGGLFDMSPTAPKAVQRNAICWRVEDRGHEGFHAVRDGVHAGGSRQHRRQAQREFGVANSGFGHQMPGVKAQFAVVVHDDDRPTRHLTARAAGGGDCNQGRHPFGDSRGAAFNGGVVGQRPFVRCGNGHAFGAINGAAAAHSNQAIATLCLVNRRGGAHGGLGRVGGRLVKHSHRHARQRVQRLLQNAGRLDPRVGDDQRAADARVITRFSQQGDGAKFKLDLGQVANEGHGCSRVWIKMYFNKNN